MLKMQITHMHDPGPDPRAWTVPEGWPALRNPQKGPEIWINVETRTYTDEFRGIYNAPCQAEREGLVLQEGTYDCGAAVLSMATGLSLRRVKRRLLAAGLYDPRAGIDDMLECLELLGYPWGDGGIVQQMSRIDGDNGRYLREMCWGRRAIMMVDSLNSDPRDEPYGHFVWWNGHEVFDPSMTNHYKRADQLFPDDVIFFHENLPDSD